MSRTATDKLGALLSGQRGPVHYRYRLYESDLIGTVGAFIKDIDSGGGQVTMSNFRDHFWELNLTRRELTGEVLQYLGDYVRLFVEVFDQGDTNEWLSFPMGLYKLDPYTSSHEHTGSTYALTGRSPEVLFLDDTAHLGHTVGANVGVLARVRQILVNRANVPMERIEAPATDKTLGTPMYFDPFQDSSSVVWLRIINAILNAGGFYALYTDNEGRFTVKEIEDSSRVEPDAIYTSEGPHRMVTGTIDEEFDLESFSNRVVYYSGDPNQFVPVVGVATNRDPNSPGSVQNLGRVVQREPIMTQNIVSQQEANRLAQAELSRQTAANHRVTFSTLPDPRREPRENYRLEVHRADGKGILSGMWGITGWTLPLGNPPQPMSHECSRREKLG